MTLFPGIAFINKSNASNGRNPTSCSFPALLIPFPDIAFINKEAASGTNEKVIGAIIEATKDAIRTPKSESYCPFLALMTPFLNIAFVNKETKSCTNEKAIGAINEAAIDAIIAPRIPPFYFLVHVLLIHEYHQLIDMNFLVALGFY